MNWHAENAKLYPLQSGEKLLCVDSVAPWFTKGKTYTADRDGYLHSDGLGAWFTDQSYVPISALFHRASPTPRTLIVSTRTVIHDQDGNELTADDLRALADQMEGV